MQSYDTNEPSKFIAYLDANNLYGWTMSQYLPYSEFNWLNQKEIEKKDQNQIKFKFCLNTNECNFIEENSSDGYILEVDIEYLDELHELHNDYRLTPEKPEISDNMLSNYYSNIANEYCVKIGGANKLDTNLGN